MKTFFLIKIKSQPIAYKIFQNYLKKKKTTDKQIDSCVSK
jgi:hypothetical protein